MKKREEKRGRGRERKEKQEQKKMRHRMEEIKEVETDAVTSRRLVSEDRPLSSRRRPLIRPHTQTDSSLRPHTNPTF